MKEYLLNRSIANLHEASSSEIIENNIYANERHDKKEYNHLVIQNSTFATMGFKLNKFNDCSFRYCIFINCYFRGAYFNNVIFNGCKFIDCNFASTSYINCDFTYASFKGCYIEYDALRDSLPREGNLRWALCTNLSIECLNLGSYDNYRKYYFEEMKATEEKNIEIILRRQSYYKSKYGSWNAFIALLNLIISKINKIFWGYGERISTLIFNIFVVILFFSIYYFNAGDIFAINGSRILTSLTFYNSIYLSICNFANISSDISATVSVVRYIFLLESVIGVIAMGFFVTALFKYINRR